MRFAEVKEKEKKKAEVENKEKFLNEEYKKISNAYRSNIEAADTITIYRESEMY